MSPPPLARLLSFWTCVLAVVTAACGPIAVTPDGGRDAASDAPRTDGGPVTCGTTTCAPGQACCAATGACYDPRCLACCMEPPPPPPPPDGGMTDGGGTDGGPVPCGTATCAPGQACCAATGACYDPRCLSCCMEPPPPPPPPPDGGTACGSVTCGPGQVCCAATGRCYDPRCLSCCMEPPPPPPPPPDSGVRTCRVDADCGSADQVCVYAAAGCGVSNGVCQMNFACGRASLQYCGCDGVTFWDTCAGPTRPWVSMGACTSSGDAGVADSGGGGTTCSSVSCGPGMACCPYTGACYSTACLSCCMPPPPPPPDAGGPIPCLTDAMCPTGMACCLGGPTSAGHCYDTRCDACCRPSP